MIMTTTAGDFQTINGFIVSGDCGRDNHDIMVAQTV